MGFLNWNIIMNSTTISTKICSKCKIQYFVNNFYKDSRAKDKLTSQCKYCYLNNRNRTRKKRYDKRHNKTIFRCLEQAYYSAKNRCENPTVHNYHRYGGRGIKCLFKSKSEFINYVLKEIFKVKLDNLQMDRIDNDGNYEKGNIRFITAKENGNNKGN